MMARVWEIELPAEQQQVMLVIADHADDDGRDAYPGIERIAWKVGKQQRAVQYIIKRLCAAGILEVVAHTMGGRGLRKEFSIHLEKGAKKAPFVPSYKRVQNPAQKGAKSTPERVQPATQKGATGDTAHAWPSISEPSLEPSGEPSGIHPVVGTPAQRVFEAYKNAILPKAKRIDATDTKIRARLKTFSEEELLQAVANFAADDWNMNDAKNGNRGAGWFFQSDQRIEGFVNLEPRSKSAADRNGSTGRAGATPHQARSGGSTLRPGERPLEERDNAGGVYGW